MSLWDGCPRSEETSQKEGVAMNVVMSVVLLTVSLIFPIRVNRAYAPELNGYSNITFVAVDATHFKGTMVNDWVKLAFRGTINSTGYATGTIWQTAGPTLMDRSCPTCADYPMKTIRFKLQMDGHKEFRGAIYFRGHWRKFCGGYYSTPSNNNCLLR